MTIFLGWLWAIGLLVGIGLLFGGTTLIGVAAYAADQSQQTPRT